MKRYFMAAISCCGHGRRAHQTEPASPHYQEHPTRVVQRWPAFLTISMPRRPTFNLGASPGGSRDAQPSFEHSVRPRGPQNGVQLTNGGIMTPTTAAVAAGAPANNYSSNSIALSDRATGENKSVSQATTTTARSVDGRGVSEERLPAVSALTTATAGTTPAATGAKTAAVTTVDEIR